MPKGVYPRKPRPKKVYPAALVQRIAGLYAEGYTQTEIGATVGVSQHVVWRVMGYHSIPRRTTAKRHQSGPQNDSWKGDDATYTAFHLRVATMRGRPSKCEVCGTDDPAKRYEWANLTRHYADLSDYARMCSSCHSRHDRASAPRHDRHRQRIA